MALTPELDRYIQALPQELQDHILDLMTTIQSDVVTVNTSYRPSSQLAINQKTRNKFAEQYFSTTTFKFSKMRDGEMWLGALTEEHREMVANMRFHRETGEMFYSRFVNGWTATLRKSYNTEWQCMTVKADCHIARRLKNGSGRRSQGDRNIRMPIDETDYQGWIHALKHLRLPGWSSASD